MQTVSVYPAAQTAKRKAAARVKAVIGVLSFGAGLSGLAAVWNGLHSIFNYAAVWPLGILITGFGFVLDARAVFRTGKQTNGPVSIVGTIITLVGMSGPLLHKWTQTQTKIGLWPLLAPLLLFATAVVGVVVCAAVKAAQARFGSLFSRQR